LIKCRSSASGIRPLSHLVVVVVARHRRRRGHNHGHAEGEGLRAAALLALLVLAVVAQVKLSAEEEQLEFTNFISAHGKTYASATDFFFRFSVFREKLNFVRKHNAGNSSWVAGINQFSDMTESEVAKSLGAIAADVTTDELAFDIIPANDVDWRNKGVITNPKNQGQCGSCWAFSATGTLEAYNVIFKKNPLVSLSEQQLVDCAKPGNQGCNGGMPDRALTWLANNGGPCTQTDYPYTGRDGTCKKTCKGVFQFKGPLTAKGEDNLVKLLNAQPVSVAIDASAAFQSYKGGTFTGPCSSTSINHAVLAVGYTDAYWIVKNSWGSAWGANGYIYMVRGKNICNINNYLTVPAPQS